MALVVHIIAVGLQVVNDWQIRRAVKERGHGFIKVPLRHFPGVIWKKNENIYLRQPSPGRNFTAECDKYETGEVITFRESVVPRNARLIYFLLLFVGL